MLIYPDINPNALELGTFTIKWYGICYLLSFICGYWLMICRINPNNSKFIYSFNKEQVVDLLFYISIGVIFGGRIGYILMYHPRDCFFDPLALIQFWLPGRSFHGGLIGVLVAIWFYAVKKHCSFFSIVDFIAPIVPIGIAFGRLGNFINGELYGRVTDVAWGMVFPHVDLLTRHPSQIYEFLLEGVLLFFILNLNDNFVKRYFGIYIARIVKNKSALFLTVYALFRIFVENYRQPDLDQPLIANMTMGQLLSIPMLLSGIMLFLLRSKEFYLEKPD